MTREDRADERVGVEADAVRVHLIPMHVLFAAAILSTILPPAPPGVAALPADFLSTRIAPKIPSATINDTLEVTGGAGI